MNAETARHALRALALAAATSAGAGALLLGCTTGTPAAPEGSTIRATFDFVDGSRNVETGDFEAIVIARILDSLSGVPQTGVQVNFHVTGGIAEFRPSGSSQAVVRTDDDGVARALLSATGAVDQSSQVTVDIFSGGADEAQIMLTVFGGSSETARDPQARFTVSPTSPRPSDEVTADVSGSTDPDCPGGEPDDWEIEWGDDTTSSGTFDGETTARHTYSGATAGSSQTITLTVTNCVGRTDTTSRSITFQ